MQKFSFRRGSSGQIHGIPNARDMLEKNFVPGGKCYPLHYKSFFGSDSFLDLQKRKIILDYFYNFHSLALVFRKSGFRDAVSASGQS